MECNNSSLPEFQPRGNKSEWVNTSKRMTPPPNALQVRIIIVVTK